MMRIGEFSTLAKITVKTLRFYDEIGLFKPSFVDDNGYRYYSIDQLGDLQKIISLREIDMPIDEIKSIMSGADIVVRMNNRLKELENELQRNRQNISLVKKYLARAKKGDFMKDYQAKKITIAKCVVYYKHGVIDSMADMFPFILAAGEEVRANNPTLKCASPEYCFVTYGAEEYKEKDVELEYAEAVEGFGKESENIKFKEMPETQAISVMHKGSYSKLGEAYAFAIDYVKQHGYEIAAPIREVYINGCWDKETEDEYLTEIQVPVK